MLIFEDVQKMILARVGKPVFEYRGFLIQWRGYIPTRDSTILTGQWIAYSLHKHPNGSRVDLNICSTTGGTVNEYRAGDRFDLSGENVYFDDPQEKAVEAAVSAKLRLLSYIDQMMGEFRGDAH